MKHIILFLLFVIAGHGYAQDFKYVTTSGDTINAYKPINTNKTHIFYRDENKKTIKIAKSEIKEELDLTISNPLGTCTIKFFVEEIDVRGNMHDYITQKLKTEGYEVVYNQDKADYIVKTSHYHKGMGTGIATLIILDKDKNVLGETEKAKGQSTVGTAYSGRAAAIKKATDKYLIELIQSLELCK